MHDMLGFAMLVELSQKPRRRKLEFDHLREKGPFRLWLSLFIPSLHPWK
jgi:hypothetical protein